MRLPRKIVVNDKMQKGSYILTEAEGKNFDPNFKPELSPEEMLELGVFGGRYMTDCKDEFPWEWFSNAKLSSNASDPKLNFFGVKASKSLKYWQEKGWINEIDPRGWFQWYCRYYFGRRVPEEDVRQIGRWRAMKRHVAQIRANCYPGDWNCRPKQRQALLHWAYDSRKI